MTRINVVDPSVLSREHLVAEYRELPRVFKLAEAFYSRKHREVLPKTYRLGEGHVKFFYVRLGWLRDRFRALVAEMQRRGYSPTYTEPYPIIDGEIDVPYTPSEEDVATNMARLRERQPEFYK